MLSAGYVVNESVEIGIWTRGIGFLSRLDLVIKKRRLNLPDSLTAIPKKGNESWSKEARSRAFERINKVTD